MLPSPAWKTLAIRMPYFSPTLVMNRRMCGSLVRGTTPSWVQKVGLSRPMAPKADLRLFQIATYSGSFFVRQAIALRTSPPLARTISAIACASRVEPGLEPVDLDDEHGPGVGREAEAERLLDGLDHQVVEHLQRGGDDPRGDDPADGLGRRVDRREDAEERPPRLGVAGEVDDDLADDAERPLVADDQARQVVPGHVLDGAAGLERRAVGQDQLDALDVVDRHAVLERVRPARVGRDVAADRAGGLARRVGRVVEARAGEGPREPDVDDARLDDRVAVAEVDLEDALHPGQADHHPAADGERPAREARPGPARDERHARAVARLDRRDQGLRDRSGRRRRRATFFSMTYPSHS